MKRSNVNLLLCLDALLTERSVTRAAQRLEMSQPGMSNALARLRELTGDPLLIRSGNGLILSERAQSLTIKVRNGVELMYEIFANEGPFDPARATGVVTIAAAESVGVAIMPGLLQALARAAPALTVHVRAPDPERLREWLGEGECDIAIGHFPDASAELRSTVLFTQGLSCVRARNDNGPRGPISLDDYLAGTHVMFGSPFSPRSTMETTLDHALAALGCERRTAVRVSTVLLIPYLVANSDHLATLPTWLSRHFATHLPLELSPLPFSLPVIESRMMWHERTHRLGLFIWLREIIRSIVPGLVTTGTDVRAGD